MTLIYNNGSVAYKATQRAWDRWLKEQKSEPAPISKFLSKPLSPQYRIPVEQAEARLLTFDDLCESQMAGNSIKLIVERYREYEGVY